jgi:HAD superfamily hydrolase (TIGR01490 family)
MKPALFDLDHTLLDGDSNELWLDHLIELGMIAAEVRDQQAAYFQAYLDQQLDIGEYIRFHLAILRSRPVADWEPILDDYWRTRVQPRLAPAGLAVLQAHQAQGDPVALITATNGFLSGAIGARLGVTVLATQVEVQAGYVTGQYLGMPCFQEGKIDYMRRWLAHLAQIHGREPALVRFYSDSSNDRYLLLAVSNPVVVNGDDGLMRLAREHGWPHQQWKAGSSLAQHSL